jgi:hypothetical protein
VFYNGVTAMALIVRLICLVVGCLALYVAAFMYEDESGRWQSRVEELWVTISDRAKVIGSTTAAFFNEVSTVDTALLDRIYGRKVISVRMVGMSTVLSLASTFLLIGATFGAPHEHPFQMRPNMGYVWCGLALLLIAIPPMLSESRIAVAPTLIPVAVCVLFLIFSFTNMNPEDHWSRPMTAALSVSLLSDLATTAMIRKNIGWLSRETRVLRIGLAVSLQILWILVLILPPGLAGYFRWRHQRRDPVGLALLLTCAFNLNTGLLSAAFASSLLFVIAHKISWPVLERVLYPAARWQIIRNRKLMGGLAVVCLAHAFHLTSGALKSIMEVAAK